MTASNERSGQSAASPWRGFWTVAIAVVTCAMVGQVCVWTLGNTTYGSWWADLVGFLWIGNWLMLPVTLLVAFFASALRKSPEGIAPASLMIGWVLSGFTAPLVMPWLIGASASIRIQGWAASFATLVVTGALVWVIGLVIRRRDEAPW